MVVLYQFLYSIDPRAPWQGMLTLIILLITVPIFVIYPYLLSQRIAWTIKYGCIVAVIIVFPLHATFLLDYLHYPNYLDLMEPNIAAVSWLGWEGYPLYPSLTTGDAYCVPYGPLLYQALGFTLWLIGPSIAASKALGMAAFATTALLSFVALRRSGAGVVEALTIAAAQCAVAAGFTSQGYAGGVRSDAIILLAAQCAVLTGTATPRVINAIALGLLGGALVNLKIHGGLYILPIFIYFICRSEPTALRGRLVIVTAIAGLFSFLIPFLPKNVSISSYIEYFQLLSQQGHLVRWIFEKNVVFALALLAPLAAIFISCGRKLPPWFGPFLIALCACVFLVTIPASEDGAGPYHLLPFLPSVCWAFSVMRREMAARFHGERETAVRDGVTLALLVALVFGYGPMVEISWERSLHYLADSTVVQPGVAEIDRALDANPGVTLAVGGSAASYAARLRVIPVFRGNPLPLDSTAWNALQAMPRVIRECRVGLWLLPANTPLDDDFLPSDDLATFHAHYTLQKAGQVFDQWRCTRKQAKLRSGLPGNQGHGREQLSTDG